MKKVRRYFKECWLELKRVAWPGKDEVLHSTWVVIISTIVFALVLGLVDSLFGLCLGLIF